MHIYRQNGDGGPLGVQPAPAPAPTADGAPTSAPPSAAAAAPTHHEQQPPPASNYGPGPDPPMHGQPPAPLPAPEQSQNRALRDTPLQQPDVQSAQQPGVQSALHQLAYNFKACYTAAVAERAKAENQASAMLTVAKIKAEVKVTCVQKRRELSGSLSAVL